MREARNLLCFVCLTLPLAVAQEKGPGTDIAVHMLVTVEALHGKEVPVLRREDVVVHKGHDRLPVTDWVPLEEDHAALELFLLVDDSSGASFGMYLEDLRKFIDSQPPATAIGVGYMRNGTVFIAQNLAADHALAAKALRLPLGAAGAGGSPYLSLSDLIKRWPANSSRHEVLMVTDGIDRLGGPGPLNPYVTAAIENAQRAGIIVYSIYTSGIGHFGHSFWRMSWGQNHLAQVGEETGGEAYFLGLGTPVSFEPYLADLAGRLLHQYRITFLAKPEPKASFQSVKLTTEVPNAELVTATRVYVPGTQSK